MQFIITYSIENKNHLANSLFYDGRQELEFIMETDNEKEALEAFKNEIKNAEIVSIESL